MIKNKNIDPTSTFPCQTIYLHTCGTSGTANTTTIDAWVAPWAGKVVNAQLYAVSATSATGTVDVWKSTAASSTTGTSIFSAAYTNATTAMNSVDISSSLTTTVANLLFAAGDVLTLRVANAAITKPTLQLGVRPLVSKELFGY